jgi:hypothetical protein
LNRKSNPQQTAPVNYIGGVTNVNDTAPFSNGSDNLSGDCGQICYLFENYIKDGPIDSTRIATTNNYIKPAIGSVTFSVKAGNYSAESLARLITEQINGSIVNDDENYLTNRLYNKDSPNYAGNQTSAVFGKPQNGITTNLVYSQKFISGTGNNTIPNLQWYYDEYGILADAPQEKRLKNDIFVNVNGLDLWERGMKQPADALGTTRPIEAFDFLKCNVDPNGNIITEPLPGRKVYSDSPTDPASNRNLGKGIFDITYPNDIPTIARANMIMIPIIPQNVLDTTFEYRRFPCCIKSFH